MTANEFIQAAAEFCAGEIVFVSGTDYFATYDLLEKAKNTIEAGGKNALVYNSRATTVYEQRMFYKDTEQAMLWEYIKLLADGEFVILVANHYDEELYRNIPRHTIVIDVVMDLLSNSYISDIPDHNSKRYPNVREIYPFINRVYFHEGDSVELIKTQHPER